MVPTNEILEQTLGASYAAYETLQEALPGMEIEQEWQWYTPHKAWFAKGQHWWTTSRETRKEKNLYWLYVHDQCFSVAVWFKQKNREAVSGATVSDATRQLISQADTLGKVPTFPVVFMITTVEPLSDLYTLLDLKKGLEK